MLSTQTAFAQASSCSDAILSPFCSGIAQYPANYDGTGSGSGPQAPVGPDYGCLGTQGNPTYFSLTIEQSGSIDFTLDNSANVDIDFILWGPFASIAAANNACDSMGQGGIWGNIDTCSYSAIGQEPVTVSNAIAGEVYILMVTNYSNQATNIFSTNNNGSGNIACPCAIPYTVDTMPALSGNTGVLTDTSNGINQFVVCPNQFLGIEVGAKASLNDTLSLYAPFTTLNSSFFVNNSIFTINPNAPLFDSLTIYTTITPQLFEIGVNNFTLGIKNDLFTGGLVDSSCFDQVSIQVVVPGVKTTDRNICSGEIFQLQIDSIPTTSVGSSSYSWSQLSGPPISFSSTNVREPILTIPISSVNSSIDSILLEVDYNYGGLCPMKDTMVLYFPDMSIAANSSPDTLCLGNNGSLLVNLSDTLTPSICDDYDVNIIPFSPVAASGLIAVSNYTALSSFPASDEGISAGLPVGFNFEFYCNNYNTFYIHTNGFITFSNLTGTPGLLTGSSLPIGALPNNLIALSWEDLDVGNGGSVNYALIGNAPNRQLIVNFNNIQNWSGFGAMTAQAILSESDNSIEIHISSNTFAISTIGIENAAGNLAHFHSSLVQGQSLGSITNTAYRFSPKNFGPFYTWTPSNTLDVANTANPTVTPNTIGTTTYTVLVNDGACTYLDTTNITTVSGIAIPTLNCDSNSLTSINFSWNTLGLPPTGFYEYSIDGGTTWINIGSVTNFSLSNLVANSSYQILLRGNDGANSNCSEGPVDTINCSTAIPDCSNNPPININLTTLDLTCNNNASGCVYASVSGGSGNPLNLFWSTGQNSIDSLCNLDAGTYTIVVTDTLLSGATAVVCIDSQSIQVTEPALLNITLSSNNPSCIGLSNGSINASLTGGTAPYNYSWSNASTTATIDSLASGSYSLSVSDSNGCIALTTTTLTASNSLDVNINPIVGMLSCDSAAIGLLEATVLLGTNLTYSWNNGDSTATISGLSVGNYTVTATDGNNCSDTASFTISAPLVPNVNAFVSVTGLQSIAIPIGTTVNISAGSSGWLYNWTASSDNPLGLANITNPLLANTTVNPDPEGSYTYTVVAQATTNDSTCFASDSIVIVVESPFQGFSNAFSPNADGVNDYFAPVTLNDQEVKTFRIYNRWGQEVYNGDAAHGLGWDGTLNGVEQASDVYLFLVIYQRNSDPEAITVRGEFTLIR